MAFLTDLSGLSFAGTCEILLIKCTTESCDLPDWSIQSCINLCHHMSLERFYDLTVSKTFQKCFFNEDNIIILLLNTMIHYNGTAWLLKEV